jgi:phage protein D/phage baseplate assembly protein gpV
MAGAQFTNTLRITVAGTPLPDDLLHQLTDAFVDDNLHLPDMFSLRFRDPDRLVLTKSGLDIGKPVELAVVGSEHAAPTRLMVGEVTSIEAEAHGSGTFTTIRGYDASHRLLHGSGTAVFVNATYADIVRKVATQHGLQTGKVDDTPVVHEYVTQANTSSWQFLRSLADEIGYDLFVEDGKLTFAGPAQAGEAPSGTDAQQPYVLQLGSDLLRLRAAVTGSGQVPTIEVRGWDAANGRPVAAPVPAGTVSAEIGLQAPQLAGRFGAQPYVLTHRALHSQDRVDAAAKALAERVSGTFAELDGVVRGNPKLNAGGAVVLSNIGAPFDGKYVLTQVRHGFDPDTGYTTAITVSGRQDRSLLGLAGGAGPSAVDADRPGVVTGIVTNNQDPEQVGRVQVTMPWLNDAFTSPWARVVQTGAGPGRGTMVLPEVGDEVLVAFEHEDFATPYVLGGLYSQQHKPAAAKADGVDATGVKSQRPFVSRSGHRLEYADDASGSGIWLKTGDGKLELAMDGAETKVTVRSDGTVTITAKNGITLDSGAGDVQVVGGQKMAFKAKTGLTLDAGSGDVTLKGVNVALTGTAQAKVGAPSVSVAGDALCEIKAAMVKIN